LLFLEFRQIHLQFRVAIFPQKIIPRKTEQTKTLIHSVGIPSVLRNGKCSEFRSEPFRRKIKKARNSVAHHFTEEKNARNFAISLRSIFKEDLNSRHSIPNHFAEEKNTRDFVPNPYAKKITFGIVPKKKSFSLEIFPKKNTFSFTFSAE
jgi:hypothetical protein